MNKSIVIVLVVLIAVAPLVLRSTLGNFLVKASVIEIKKQKFDIGSVNVPLFVSDSDLIKSYLIDKYGELTYKLLDMDTTDISLGVGAYSHEDKVYIKPSKGDLATYLVKIAGEYTFDGKKPDSCKIVTLGEFDFKKKSDELHEEHYQNTVKFYDDYLGNITSSLAINNIGYQGAVNELTRYTKEADEWIESCITNFPESECSPGILTIKNNKQGIDDAIKEFSNTIADQNSMLIKIKGDRNHFLQTESKRRNGKLVSSNLTGFTSKNVIYLRLDNKTEFIAYLNTYFHELMHCMSWDKGEMSLEPFFEEGATDYYAQVIFNTRVKNQFEPVYSHELEIFKNLKSRVGKDMVMEVYQSKDNDILCDVLSLVSHEDCDAVKNAGNEVFYAYDPERVDNKERNYSSFSKLLNK